MSVKCQVIMDAMERIAPRHLAESWDNVGLLVGSPAQNVRKMLVCLDVSEAVVDRAIADGVNMIIAHHPLIFKPLKNLRTDLPQGKLLSKLMQHSIIVFAAHTNLDIVGGGVNDVLADLLELEEVGVLAQTSQENLIKLAVFVPSPQAEDVQAAIAKAGAGHIGNYSHCSFKVAGKGSFLPLTGTNPFIGQPGDLETVDEVRIETIVPEKLVRRVVKAMLAAHPYEEVAYDLYPLNNAGQVQGLGRIGKLKNPLDPESFAKQVKNALAARQVRLVISGGRPIKKVALCSGSGAEFIMKAAYCGADVLVTGDVKYHDAQKAQEYGIHLIDAGHFATEMPIAEKLAEQLTVFAETEKWHVEIFADNISEDVFLPVD